MQNKAPKGKRVQKEAPCGTAVRDKRKKAAEAAPKSAPARPPLTRKERRIRARACWWAAPVSAALVCVLGVILLYCFGSLRNYAVFLQKRQAVDRATFYPGLTLEGVDLSDLTLEQALAHYQTLDEQNRIGYEVTLTFEGQAWPLTSEDFGYESDYRQVLFSAWSVGRYGSLEERYDEVTRAAGEWRRDYQIERRVDEGRLREKLAQITAGMTTPGKDASVRGFDVETLSFSFDEGATGLTVDVDELARSVFAAVESGGGEVPIERVEIPPATTAAELAGQFGQIASATTDASSSSKNRLTNLKLACRTLSGTRVDPGETFSFNQTLGKRTAEKGYKAAPAYENGLTTQQLGGGICQVSTTLFNAVAKSDLKVTDRSPHSRPSSYVGLGKDAAVDWPSQDFRFQNNTSYPVYLVAELTKDKRVTIAVYGKKLPNGMSIKITSKQVSVTNPGADQISYDPTLAPGERVVVEKARKGYKAIAYKEYYDDAGNLTDRVELCKSSYRAAGAVIKMGP